MNEITTIDRQLKVLFYNPDKEVILHRQGGKKRKFKNLMAFVKTLVPGSQIEPGMCAVECAHLIAGQGFRYDDARYIAANLP